MHEEAKKRGEDVNCSYLLGGESDAIVQGMTTTTNSSEPSQFLSKLHLKQYPKENALLSFFLSFFLRPLGGPDSRLQNIPKTYSFFNLFFFIKKLTVFLKILLFISTFVLFYFFLEHFCNFFVSLIFLIFIFYVLFVTIFFDTFYALLLQHGLCNMLYFHLMQIF